LKGPFFSYFGAKWTLSKHYPPPRYEHVVELFAGSACYACRYPHKRVTLVEKYPPVAALWRYLIGVSESELRALPDLLPDQTVDDLNVCDEARYLIGFWCNKAVSSPRKRLSSWAKQYPRKFWCAELRAKLASQLHEIRHWEVREGDFDKVAPVLEGATYFVDPPYEKAGKAYPEKHVDYSYLAECCRALAASNQVIVCEAEGAEWLPFSPLRAVRATPRKGNTARQSNEVCWTT
jgi:site-specific DNA-adenine methylase